MPDEFERLLVWQEGDAEMRDPGESDDPAVLLREARDLVERTAR